MPISDQTYHALLLDEPEGPWELHDGELREKPGMSAEHNDAMTYLGFQLAQQLDTNVFRVRINSGHVHRGATTYYIPDVCVLPAPLVIAQHGEPGTLEIYEAPLPVVAEVWSVTTGRYDVDAKLPEYQRRGDKEIWRLHPYERSVRAWRRQPDGGYEESVYRGGIVPLASLAGVTIDLDAIFALFNR